jgi:hypothetical protein
MQILEVMVPTLPSFKYEFGGHCRADGSFVSYPVPSLRDFPSWPDWTMVDPIL